MTGALDWLIARPIAHRGLHDPAAGAVGAAGVIENTAAAVRAAIAANYSIEVDLQISVDGEAMVHHDDVLGRLTDGEGRLDQLTAAALKRVPFRAGGGGAGSAGSAEPMLTLGELCDLVGGRVAIVPELKSRFVGDDRLPVRVASVLAGYRGPVAPMSFDPAQLAVLRQKAPRRPRGIVAAKYRPHPYWDQMPPWLRYGMGSLLPALSTRPQFVAYAIDNLPAFAPFVARRIARLPLITWVVRSEAERCRAARFADQMIFEGFRP